MNINRDEPALAACGVDRSTLVGQFYQITNAADHRRGSGSRFLSSISPCGGHAT
jgi:hypothetical protein